MDIVRQTAEIVSVTPHPLRLIEMAGRTCYRSEPRGKAADFVRRLVEKGHESVIEHAVATIALTTDRGVTHELVRHRLASYSQESTRYCTYRGEIEFVLPVWCEVLRPGRYSTDSSELLELPETERCWAVAMLLAEELYHRLLKHGWRAEQARAVLPNSLATRIVVTANMREWRHILKLRTSAAAHPQMRDLMLKVLALLKEKTPVLFDDIGEASCDATKTG